MSEQDNIHELSSEAKAELDAWLLKFPKGKNHSAIMPGLTFVQNENGGYLTDALMDAVADYLDVPKIAVYEVATFYSMYELKPVGRHKICVCTNVSCMLCGSHTIVNHLQKKLNINFGEITKDGKYSLKEVECLAACGGAPMMQIGDTYYENLTPEKVDDILAGLE